VAVPFTPVPGPRLLVQPSSGVEARQALLARAAIALTERIDGSSLHVTFLAEEEWKLLGRLGFLMRIDQQYHWLNQGYATFDDFLARLSSRKR
jgi:predicted N-acyltransferase